ncbi:hypothetical protein M2T96_27420, partial [Klebsiella pneumoniae]|nr:hypothetical protein [Klebsiella pneumoniae]
QNDVTLKMPAFEWVHVQLHQQKGMISLSPPTICNSAEKSTFTESIYENESVFGQLGEPHRFPEVSRVRETLRRWRFYHEFAIGRHSPLRQPAVGYRSPVLDSDGQNLAAAFQTIVEIGAEEILH